MVKFNVQFNNIKLIIYNKYSIIIKNILNNFIFPNNIRTNICQAKIHHFGCTPSHLKIAQELHLYPQTGLKKS